MDFIHKTHEDRCVGCVFVFGFKWGSGRGLISSSHYCVVAVVRRSTVLGSVSVIKFVMND